MIKDPDLFRLFENSFPNTLDTTIKWRGYAKGKTNKSSLFLSLECFGRLEYFGGESATKKREAPIIYATSFLDKFEDPS